MGKKPGFQDLGHIHNTLQKISSFWQPLLLWLTQVDFLTLEEISRILFTIRSRMISVTPVLLGLLRTNDLRNRNQLHRNKRETQPITTPSSLILPEHMQKATKLPSKLFSNGPSLPSDVFMV